jgi:hypothetical protein
MLEHSHGGCASDWAIWHDPVHVEQEDAHQARCRRQSQLVCAARDLWDVGPSRSRHFSWADRSCAPRTNQFAACLVDRSRGDHPLVSHSGILFFLSLLENEYFPDGRDPGASWT